MYKVLILFFLLRSGSLKSPLKSFSKKYIKVLCHSFIAYSFKKFLINTLSQKVMCVGGFFK